MKSFGITFILLTLTLLLGACTEANGPDLDIYEDYSGTLTWGGQPAVDGTGLLFESKGTIYGVPGDKSEFSGLFSDNSNSVEIKTDFVITGKETVRGWGATFPEAILIKPERL